MIIFLLDNKINKKKLSIKKDYFKLIINNKVLGQNFIIKNFVNSTDIRLRNKVKKILYYKGFLDSREKKSKDYYLKNSLKLKLKFFKKFIFKKKRIRRYVFNKRRLNFQPFINELKITFKFQRLIKDYFAFCKVYFKYTGSNIFTTLTNNKGEVIFSYSAGVFRNLRTRKEKTTVLVAQQLGQLLSLRVYRSNAKYVCFIPYLNNRKVRYLVRSTMYGFHYVRLVQISFIFIKRKVIRNGVRSRKIARK